ncbi:MAG: hypothetical protein IJU30_07165, partial [Lachnospiraceae bacterium]|nr:hypothetical protein [Lachnospiraceae bacterium]
GSVGGGAKLYHKKNGQYHESSAYDEAFFRIPGEYSINKDKSISAAYGKTDMFFGVSNASDLYKTHLGNKIMQIFEILKDDIEKRHT